MGGDCASEENKAKCPVMMQDICQTWKHRGIKVHVYGFGRGAAHVQLEKLVTAANAAGAGIAEYHKCATVAEMKGSFEKVATGTKLDTLAQHIAKNLHDAVYNQIVMDFL